MSRAKGHGVPGNKGNRLQVGYAGRFIGSGYVACYKNVKSEEAAQKILSRRGEGVQFALYTNSKGEKNTIAYNLKD